MNYNKIVFAVIILFSCQYYIAQDDNALEEIEKIIEEITNKYAPDKRVAIFDIKVSLSNILTIKS